MLFPCQKIRQAEFEQNTVPGRGLMQSVFNTVAGIYLSWTPRWPHVSGTMVMVEARTFDHPISKDHLPLASRMNADGSWMTEVISRHNFWLLQVFDQEQRFFMT